ncbi:TraB/GumN family protein [Flavobacterium proteolyticum]|uniref:TraB/GumN family protein n=1 Tax=Flavobacterium proteolyticum TaxID=2911683 RepID=A0ABR9WSK2_9FLAO|nr:TraB/GumN family protein [Flavobacterium proteolyticum]MBE9575454.1 TraB/GumN family protein [Flavobacterium proteolyticum]
MKKIALLFALISVSLVAQEKKYQSLLWEISGNGLQKKSYVYGSMHVSDKVSYHLSDNFFKHLQEADIIANESEPRTWTTLFDLFSFYSQYANQGKFYTNFYIQPIEKDNLYPLFRSSNYNLISLLTRTNEAQKDYQEETYLDMFIYRTGRKFNKKTVGLEDVKKSTLNIMKAQAKMDETEVDKNRQAILKILKNKSYDQALNDFYREKDLDMIDSLTMLSSPKSFLKAMLFDRNIEMVKNMDSIMKTGSLFSAIGAAHLPGPKGVIELLRAKGYKVTPVFGNYTEKGKAAKKQIEEYFTKPELKNRATADGMISLPLFEIVLENGEDLESPDLVNGGYVNVKRKLLNDFLNKKNKTFNVKTLDSLFYENIPGEILEKKSFQEKNYWVYDIKSKTKTGNAQRYRYYITPLEIISVIMGGEGDYVRRFEEDIFSKIEIKNSKNTWEKISPIKGNFEVQVPAYNTYTGNKNNGKDNSDIAITALDEKKKSFYFLIEKTLSEIDNLENSEYELKRIHQEFYAQHELDSTQTKFNKERIAFFSKSSIENREIQLKSQLNGNKYYLLGTVNAEDTDTKRFFDSFEIKPSLESESYRIFRDTTNHFSIEIPEKQNEHLDFLVEKELQNGNKKKNHFTTQSKNYQFLGSSGSIIQLNYYKYHRYESEKSLDSIWKNYRKQIIGDVNVTTNETPTDIENDNEVIEVTTPGENFNLASEYMFSDWDKKLFPREEKLKIIDEKISFDKDNNIHVFEAMVSKPSSKQAIKYKLLLNGNTIYELSTLVAKDYDNKDPFVEKTFNSIALENKKTENILENKMDLFLNDVRSKHDSIRYSALKSIDYLTIEKADLPKFKTLLNTFKFRDDETEILGELYEKLGRIKSPEVISYLENAYKKEKTNTVIQFAVLRALAFQKSKEAYKKIQELLEYDLPVSDNEYEIIGLFNHFEEDLENSQVLFPNIFQYYSIKEFHEPIVSFTHQLLLKNHGNAKKLKSYKKMILTNAKLEYKRLASWKSKQNFKNEDEDEYYEEDEAPIEDFISYYTILYPFKAEKDVAQLIKKATDLKIEKLDLAFAEVQLEKTNQVDSQTMDKIVENEKIQFIGFLMMHHMKQNSFLTKYDPKTIALAAEIYSEDIDKKKDSLSFYDSKEIRFNGKKITYFFFKKINIEENSYNTNQQKISGIAFITENGKINIKEYCKLIATTYLEEKEIDAIIKSMIDESLNDNHRRASYGKLKINNNLFENLEEY